MNCYSKREPVLFFALLLLTVSLFFYSSFSLQWLLPKTLAKVDLSWGFIILSAILMLFILHHYLFPTAIVSISASDGKTAYAGKNASKSEIVVLFDGRAIRLEYNLPQQVRLYFWNKGEYRVYVKYKYTGSGCKSECEGYTSGTINLYEDRHLEIVIPLSNDKNVVKI